MLLRGLRVWLFWVGVLDSLFNDLEFFFLLFCVVGVCERRVVVDFFVCFWDDLFGVEGWVFNRGGVFS